jgi:hypothetical protein
MARFDRAARPASLRDFAVEIEHEKLGRLENRQIGGLFAAEHPTSVGAHPAASVKLALKLIRPKRPNSEFSDLHIDA